MADIIESMINGLFTSIGVIVGSYIANRTLIKNLEKAEKILKKIKKRREK